MKSWESCCVDSGGVGWGWVGLGQCGSPSAFPGVGAKVVVFLPHSDPLAVLLAGGWGEAIFLVKQVPPWAYGSTCMIRCHAHAPTPMGAPAHLFPVRCSR